jgi:3-phosphoshikimate 1-carboxyvinyltransferase
MVEGLRRLGFAVAAEPAASRFRVSGASGAIPAAEADLFVGLAGTAARFLTALCAAAAAGRFRLDGVPQMRRRPMRGLIDALRGLGADVRCVGAEGFFPLEISSRGLRGGRVAIDARESSQMLSALLLAAPLAAAETTVELSAPVREPFVDMTVRLMGQFGAEVAAAPGGYRVAPGRYALAGGRSAYAIEPDATSASYFLALPLVPGGKLRVRGLRRPRPGQTSLQGDLHFTAVLERVGLALRNAGEGLEVAYETPAPRRGVTEDFSGFSDTFLTLAAIAPLLQGPTKISGIAHTRHQETDRVAGMARELTRLGQEVVETEDSLEVRPRPLRADQVIETYGDHRFAMSFALLGCHDLHGDGRPWLTVRDPACCAKTFPDFFDRLEAVRRNSLA